MSENREKLLEKLFKDFEFSKKQIKLFKKLRKTIPKDLNDTLLCVLVVQKKSFEKCVKGAGNLMEIVKSNNFGKIKLNERQLTVAFKEIVVFNPNLRTKDNKNLLLYRPAVLMRDTTLGLEEKIDFYLFAMYNIMSKYPRVSTSGLVIALNLKEASIFYLDVNLVRRFYSIVRKLPFRPVKIYVINAPWFFRIVLGVVSQIMPSKLISRVEVTDEETLKKHISVENLTPVYGGTAKHRMADSFRYWFATEKDKDSFDKFSKLCKIKKWKFDKKFDFNLKEEKETEKEDEDESEGESEEEEEEEEEKKSDSKSSEEEEEEKVDVLKKEKDSGDSKSSSESEEEEIADNKEEEEVDSSSSSSEEKEK